MLHVPGAARAPDAASSADAVRIIVDGYNHLRVTPARFCGCVGVVDESLASQP
jgi:hypothetical protein